MEIRAIHAGLFKLDGGAMFGVVPKTLWSRRIAADANNRCTWAMRSLLVTEGDRVLLIDTGLGDKQDDKFFAHFEPHGPTLDASLKEAGLSAEDVTDVLLTHLHFDHCGGAVRRRGERLEAAFPNATYWSHADHWAWATEPNPRERGSFLPENFAPLQADDRVRFLADGDSPMPGVTVRAFFGHTEAMLVPLIRKGEHTVAFLADLQPSIHHFPLPWVMGYDLRPLQTIAEREAFLAESLAGDYRYIFQHDAEHEACTLSEGPKGVGPGEILRVADL